MSQTLPASPVALVTLCVWVPIVWSLFAVLPARRAVIVGVVVGCLFLPIVSQRIEGLPEINKQTVPMFALYSAVVMFDRRRLRRLRPVWLDLPIILWSMGAVVPSLANDLGWYNAASATLHRLIFGVAPYGLGRMYCADRAGLRELAIGLIGGSLVYVPLCLFEVRYGPILHALVYGATHYGRHDSVRFGGWRPTVFMRHGLMLGVWMTGATLTAGWLWATRSKPRLLGASMGLWTAVLLFTTVIVKSLNAWILLVLGAIVLWSSKRGFALPLLVLTVVPVAYVGTRVVAHWHPKTMVRLVARTTNVHRAHSLQFRLVQEKRLMKKAWQRPWTGWGGWGAWRIYSARGRDITFSDSAWIMAFGQDGLPGVVFWLAFQLVPVWAFCWRWPVSQWSSPQVAPATVLALIVVLGVVDQCFNAFFTPVPLLALGGLAVFRPTA